MLSWQVSVYSCHASDVLCSTCCRIVMYVPNAQLQLSGCQTVHATTAKEKQNQLQHRGSKMHGNSKVVHDLRC